MISNIILTLLLSLLPIFITPSSSSITPNPITPSPALPPSLTLTPSPISDSSLWHYPNASVVTFNSDSLVLTSPDDPITITAWYKDKINRLGFSTRSIINTSTNGQILNKLIASHQSQTIDIEISKRPNQDLSIITIKY